jgi:hypothetical protein
LFLGVVGSDPDVTARVLAGAGLRRFVDHAFDERPPQLTRVDEKRTTRGVGDARVERNAEWVEQPAGPT